MSFSNVEQLLASLATQPSYGLRATLNQARLIRRTADQRQSSPSPPSSPAPASEAGPSSPKRPNSAQEMAEKPKTKLELKLIPISPASSPESSPIKKMAPEFHKTPQEPSTSAAASEATTKAKKTEEPATEEAAAKKSRKRTRKNKEEDEPPLKKIIRDRMQQIVRWEMQHPRAIEVPTPRNDEEEITILRALYRSPSKSGGIIKFRYA
ncbi:unnamed protein product [Bursaphelenchus okinawaensis]|uniref:Uncharacterized protein n=1 Tax=Bursaphelenchus okinawaensis TaxID=465554 RepID=A0A811JU81_9BILA|nr:unnamed protein product [Bursaphelenchus okinawaensis]CAG9084136.1 unnamed protein product [Bursaphelenchus okinawaensis]